MSERKGDKLTKQEKEIIEYIQKYREILDKAPRFRLMAYLKKNHKSLFERISIPFFIKLIQIKYDPQTILDIINDSRFNGGLPDEIKSIGNNRVIYDYLVTISGEKSGESGEIKEEKEGKEGKGQEATEFNNLIQKIITSVKELDIKNLKEYLYGKTYGRFWKKVHRYMIYEINHIRLIASISDKGEKANDIIEVLFDYSNSSNDNIDEKLVDRYDEYLDKIIRDFVKTKNRDMLRNLQIQPHMYPTIIDAALEIGDAKFLDTFFTREHKLELGNVVKDLIDKNTDSKILDEYAPYIEVETFFVNESNPIYIEFLSRHATKSQMIRVFTRFLTNIPDTRSVKEIKEVLEAFIKYGIDVKLVKDALLNKDIRNNTRTAIRLLLPKIDVGKCFSVQNPITLEEYTDLDDLVIFILPKEGKGESKSPKLGECIGAEELRRLLKENYTFDEYTDQYGFEHKTSNTKTLWDENKSKGANFPVFKLPTLGWVQSSRQLLTRYNTFVLRDLGIQPIGSSFGVGRLHGAPERIYRPIPINRKRFNETGEYTPPAENWIFYPEEDDVPFDHPLDLIPETMTRIMPDGSFIERYNSGTGMRVFSSDGFDVLENGKERNKYHSWLDSE